MPSPATRSGRLARGRQSQEEKDKNKDNDDFEGNLVSAQSKPVQSLSKTKRSTGNKFNESPKKNSADQVEKTKKSNEGKKPLKKIKENVEKEGIESSVEAKLESENSTELEKDDASGKCAQSVESPTTPMSSVRRSSRAPIPSSRFKDMEMTPNSVKAKRPFQKTPTDEPDVSEPSPKRSRKNSNKVGDVLEEAVDKETPIPSDVEKQICASSAPSIAVKQTPVPGGEARVQEASSDEKVKNDTDFGTKELKDSQNNISHEAGVDLNAEVKSVEPQLCDNIEAEMMKPEVLELSQEQNKDKVEMLTVAPKQETPMETEAVKDETLEPEMLSAETMTSTVVEEVPPQQVSVEEVGLSCHEGGIVAEETVHTYMDEKDVLVIQAPDIGENTDLVEQQPETSHTPKKLELSLDDETNAAMSSSILIKDQEVTIQEKDGKMVAIVKIPQNFGSFNSATTENQQSVQLEKGTQEQYSVLSSMKGITLNTAPPTQKNRHGYILNKKTEEQQFVTISDSGQSKILNISLEPTTVSSILKSKTETSPVKVQKSLYGRVIKQDSAMPKANTEATTHAQNSSSASIIIKKAGSNQKISLLSHSLKATNPKECKPYSLLSSPSELLQKLKGDSGKKIGQEPQTSSTKVVVITHPAKSDGAVVTNTSDNSDIDKKALTTETSDSAVPEVGSGLETQEDKLPEITNVQVVEDIATEYVTDTNKVEEIVQTILEETEDVSSKELEEGGQMACIDENDLTIGKDEQQEGGIGVKPGEIKESEIESIASYSESGKAESNAEGEMIILHENKTDTEETVVTSSLPTDIQIKQEVDMETVVEGDGKAIDIITGELKDGEAGSSKTQKIKLVDNGVVYELRIVSEDGENQTLEGETLQLEGVDEEASVVVKQELVDDESTSNETSGKSSLGTQTIYTSKRGRPKTQTDTEGADSPVHKLATIVQEGGQKKHYYYVSVVPGKTIVGKYRRSVDHSLPGCVVNEDGEYCCKECDYKTDKKANFYKHRRLHTGSKPHVCHVCKYQARTSSNLKRHMGIHDDIREFKCTQCSLSFRQKIHLERHIRYRHEEKRVKCPMCDYVCANEQPDLKMHIKRKHTQESGKVFSCPQCNIEVGSKRDLKQHLKFHKDGPELKLFCKECSFVTDCKSRLQRHLVVHSNVKPYHCGVCDYKATQKEHVVRHLRSQHKIEVNKPKRPWKKQIKMESSETLGGNSKGDFTCGDKIFACNHCTMRFAKLINLYKHLHTQHSDIMPAETDNNYYCVVCEFSTFSKKNLLVHMRRHNMTDQTPPTHVYSCVLCRYVNPRRRNLFQHMRKKHNIDISTQVDIAGMTEEEEAAVRQDGDKMADLIQTDPAVFAQASTEEMTTSTFEHVESTQVTKDGLAGVANMIKIEDLTRVSTAPEIKDGSTLVNDGGDGAPVIQTATVMQSKAAADAIEGLQALAGQAGLIIDEEVSSLDKQPTIVIEGAEGETINAGDGSIIISTDQGIVEEQVTLEDTNAGQIQQIVESAETSSEMTSLELTEEQLSSLHHGDIVQMEGQVYMVEIAPDPDSPDKQLLSFLPINQG